MVTQPVLYVDTLCISLRFTNLLFPLLALKSLPSLQPESPLSLRASNLAVLLDDYSASPRHFERLLSVGAEQRLFTHLFFHRTTREPANDYERIVPRRGAILRSNPGVVLY
ncbi:hypothetical protein AGABI1DRAFT_134939 [Agaricus bisporus var. burnettii JB137-S8]|uniref:Uncharacterized protein n=1 Tax=Agaricus bisporus var. burnettii (strain JB137-S8 / ATCC MYA-4627 / FGSC 10392) TaxID=597362 RepID=K5WDP1_AGABU|nr:uncharacterized protein AGABI1DRAFT_134939 [Agaricus bisporus var. burnettii JB137-S8]EKM73366.1 hypothetical protein AGABI1DRAFT_134939 [Agaricus bisporus var. burnettii JB137-S8]